MGEHFNPDLAVNRFRDRKWRLDHLYFIQNEAGKKIKFKMNDVQRSLLDNFWYLNLILKSRQHGITTFICLLYLDTCLFNSNKTAGIIADNLNVAEAIFSSKVKFPYDNLPDEIRSEITTEKDSGKTMRFSNGSSIQVGVSLRGGTIQYLHVSEFGKVCAKHPEKAREIVTGALNTVHVGQFITVESTAEGRSGAFYDFVQTAQKQADEKRPLSKLDYRLHFFGWWQDRRNRLEGVPLVLTADMKLYFDDLLLKHGIKLDDAQKCWYLAKKKTQGDDMFREHPSTPEEAFFAAIQGAYYQAQMTALRNKNRITVVAYEPKLAVDTAWDLGMDDTTVIVFRQRHGLENRIIDYIEGCGEVLGHYVKELQKRPYTYGTHYLPHDSSVRSLASDVVETREEKLKKLGLRNVRTVERTKNIEDGIDVVRGFLPSCWLDKEKCSRLVDALDEYRKAWNEKLGVYASYPLHNWASNPADAFRTLACGIAMFERGTGSWSSRPQSNESMAAFV